MKPNRVFYRDCTEADVQELIEHIRDGDRKEILALSPNGVTETILNSVLVSKKVWAFRTDSQLICLCGYANIEGQEKVGVPWLLGTDLMPRYQKSLLALSPPFLKKMHSIYPILTNVVHADNKDSIKFLKWLGFEFSELMYGGNDGKQPLHYFTRIEVIEDV